ncbi:DUF4126 family protein [Sphingomonas sp. LM7]|uniref:DUF4126 family protein n=1 Tax=Sphingomonas sp. LM7 TaxID=1938607 RepID=UPI000983B94E|nr:DUF4126 family protein [Sphingomonas sp. LM7]AQR72746.1 DUF4126 domain-containing protein [Sphingomonas sp. LM7]
MLRSILIGIVAGARSMTPLAMVANAARKGELPEDNGAPRFLTHPLVSLGTTALAVYELVGDKQKSAPDRVIPPAVVIRSLNAAFAGMALAPRNQRFAAAAITGATAAIASYVTFAARMRSMENNSQASTGFVEDAIVLAVATAAIRAPLPQMQPA